MKTAKEMFEELGYKYENYSVIDEICYFENKDVYYVFSLKSKTFFKKEYREPGDITLDELKAINKQIEELGWSNNE